MQKQAKKATEKAAAAAARDAADKAAVMDHLQTMHLHRNTEDLVLFTEVPLYRVRKALKSLIADGMVNGPCRYSWGVEYELVETETETSTPSNEEPQTMKDETQTVTQTANYQALLVADNGHVKQLPVVASSETDAQNTVEKMQFAKGKRVYVGINIQEAMAKMNAAAAAEQVTVFITTPANYPVSGKLGLAAQSNGFEYIGSYKWDGSTLYTGSVENLDSFIEDLPIACKTYVRDGSDHVPASAIKNAPSKEQRAAAAKAAAAIAAAKMDATDRALKTAREYPQMKAETERKAEVLKDKLAAAVGLPFTHTITATADSFIIEMRGQSGWVLTAYDGGSVFFYPADGMDYDEYQSYKAAVSAVVNK